MRYLFVHRNFPGQYLHLVRHLAGQGGHQILFLTEANANHIPGVRKVVYQPPPPCEAAHPDAQEVEHALARARVVAEAAGRLKALGFVPDVMLGHHGWGELLNLHDVWPDAPLLGYHEFYYGTHGLDVGFDPEFATPAALFPRVRAKNAVNLLALANPGLGQTPTRFQRGTYPVWARPRIRLVPEGVDLDACRPDPASRARPFVLGPLRVAPGRPLVTYVARDLEPYRGFHVVMRALPRLLRARPDVHVALVGGDGPGYGARLSHGTWREHMLAEVGHLLDPARVHFLGRVPYADHLRLLQRSDAHIYLTYPFVASWSLREALACGCAVVASDTAPVREFVRDGRNGRLTPCLDPAALALRVQEVLEDTDATARVRAGARRFARRHLDRAEHLAEYKRVIGGLTRGF